MTTSAMRKLVPAGVEERWAEVSGVRIRYLAGGSGPALLFVHGLIGFSFSWSENLEFFARDFTVIALDLPNMGYSQRSVVGCSLREMAEFVFAFMQQLGYPRFSVVGSSHGGAIGLMMAALHPEKIERLVAVSPPHPESEKTRWNVRLFASFIGPLAGRLVCNAPIAFWNLAVGHLYGSRKRMLRGTAEGYGRAVRGKETSAHLILIVRGWLRDVESIRGLLPAVKCPTLLVWGTKDKVVPLRSAAWLNQQIFNSRLCVIEGAGHLPYEEAPQEFNERVQEFLKDASAIS